MTKSYYEPLLLIVDDEIECHKSLNYMLKGYDMLSVYNTKTALLAVRKMKFDAAIVDLNFKTNKTSCFDGITLISNIREINQHLPIIAVSSYERKKMVESKVKMIGANAFILKENFSRRKWDELLKNWINYSLQ